MSHLNETLDIPQLNSFLSKQNSSRYICLAGIKWIYHYIKQTLLFCNYERKSNTSHITIAPDSKLSSDLVEWGWWIDIDQTNTIEYKSRIRRQNYMKTIQEHL